MDFVFSKEQELDSIEQTLHLLNSEKGSEKVAFAKNLVEKEGWIEFYVESTYDYEDSIEGHWWLVHPSVPAVELQPCYFDPEKAGVDTSLYYNLWH